jgi:hypothetical protein
VATAFALNLILDIPTANGNKQQLHRESINQPVIQNQNQPTTKKPQSTSDPQAASNQAKSQLK